MAAEQDFDAFVLARQGRLLRAAWLLTRDWSSAEDLVQTALERVWPRWERMDGTDAAEAYVRRTLTRAFLKDRQRLWSREWAVAEPPDAAIGGDVDRADDRDRVFRALHALPPRQRAVIVWRFFGDLTEAQTALAMGCRVGTVKSTTAKALARLRLDPQFAAMTREREQ